MQIKTFLGKDAAAVLAQVKAEMGPDAIILTSRDVSKGSIRLHEVTAGVERDGHFPHSSDEEDAESTRFGDGSASANSTPANRFGLKGNTLQEARPQSDPHSRQSASQEIPIPPGWRQWHKDWSSLRENILALMKPELRLEQLAPRQRLALEYLQREGVDDEVIISLYRNLLSDETQSILLPLNNLVKVKPWGFKEWKNKIHLIAGPFGSGKTVTALRFCLALKDEKPDVRIAIVNADCERGHGRLILRHYCELLDIEYHEACSASEMQIVLSKCRSLDRIIVDLPGLGSKETMVELMARLGLPKIADLHLILSPHYAPMHMRGLLTAYAAEAGSSIIWTKLDEAFSFGALANVAATCGLPVSAISFAPGLTDSLLPAESAQLWRILFKHQLPGALSPGSEKEI